MFKKMKNRDTCAYLFCNVVIGVICCVSFLLALGYNSPQWSRFALMMMEFLTFWNLFHLVKLIVKEKQADPQSAADN